jgi:hypothetical protein
MHPFLSLHTLAAQRGDGLLPEFVTLYKRQAAAPQAVNAGSEIDRTTKERLRAQRAPGPGMRAARAPARG